MIMPDPVLVRRRRESDLKLFHALPTAHNGHCLTSGYLQLSRNVSNEFISHVIRKFKLIWENGSEHNTKISTAMGLNVHHWWHVKWVGDYVEKRGTETKYAFWPIFCFVSFQDLVKIQMWMHYFLNTLHKMIVTKCQVPHSQWLL